MFRVVVPLLLAFLLTGCDAVPRSQSALYDRHEELKRDYYSAEGNLSKRVAVLNKIKLFKSSTENGWADNWVAKVDSVVGDQLYAVARTSVFNNTQFLFKIKVAETQTDKAKADFIDLISGLKKGDKILFTGTLSEENSGSEGDFPHDPEYSVRRPIIIVK